MTTRPINVFVFDGRRGHRCVIMYEEDRYCEAQYAVHKWRRQGFLDGDEAGELMTRIAKAAGVYKSDER